MFVILCSFGFDTVTSYIYISLTTLTLLNAEINSLTKYPCILTELFYCVVAFLACDKFGGFIFNIAIHKIHYIRSHWYIILHYYNSLPCIHFKHNSLKTKYMYVGYIPMRQLVYRVQALPQSILPLVWDFGQLSAEVEYLYIEQMVHRCVSIIRYMLATFS